MSGGTQVIIALIGLAGSLGGAYITTGQSFKAQLSSNQAAVSGLQDSLHKITTSLSGQLAQAQEQVNALQSALSNLTQQNTQLSQLVGDLEQRVNTAKVNVHALELNPALRSIITAHPH